MAKPNKNAPLGAGGRFAAVEQAAAGRKKYGAKKMASMATSGRKAAKKR